MTDYVSIRDLSVAAVIGVHPWEREIEQTLRLQRGHGPGNRRRAGGGGERRPRRRPGLLRRGRRPSPRSLRAGKFRLIETAAERVAEHLLADFALSWLRLELRKPITAGGYTAVITLERTREVP